MQEKYIIFDDFGSTAHKFKDQKQFIKENVKFFTFNQQGWDAIREMLEAQGFKQVSPENYQFMGIPLQLVPEQKYQCIGWFDERYARLYLKGVDLRKSITQSVIDKHLGRNQG
jgi:hypothetical protein